MKANTSRAGRLNFDLLADAYDDGRPRFGPAFVGDIVQELGLAPGARVLEIGAGTGQLTLALLGAGLCVVAIEPGAQLRARLRAHVPPNAPLTLRADLFEAYDGAEGPFAAVWAANAFHWLDPAVSYRKAAALLGPAGHLVLLWTFPILAPTVQRALNERVFAPLSPDFVRDPDGYLGQLDALTAEGRQELAASGAFEEPRYRFTTDVLTMPTEKYVAMLLSYGQIAAMGAPERSEFAARVREVLGERGATETVEVINHTYVCLARKRPLAERA